jgi:hypothetical protein
VQDLEEVGNVADHIVGSKSDLQDAFNNLSAGDTIWIGTPATPYRTDSWLDIDISGVTVVFQSSFADNGDPIIKPADGADVGGIRIGTNSTVSRIRIRSLGFHGNESTMTNSVKRLHGIIVDDATDVSISNCYFTKTHPYHEHNSGGSGISVRTSASAVSITECFIEDIGDRGTQVAAIASPSTTTPSSTGSTGLSLWMSRSPMATSTFRMTSG